MKVKEQDTPVYDVKGVDRAVSWVKSNSVSVLAFIYTSLIMAFLVRCVLSVRFSDNGTPVFDEKHYSTQAWQIVHNGGIEDNPGYGLVVHPPLGKMLIAAGEYLFGYTPLGWRFSSIIAGTIIVGLAMLIAYRLTKGFVAPIITGLLLNTEGTLVVMSRMGMLDIFLTMFAVATALLIVMDLTSDTSGVPWHRRWYLLGAGVTSGLAMSVKISGVYYPALAGIVLVLAVAISSKSVRETARATAMGLVFLFVVPTTVFLLSWTPWFSGESSVYRNIASTREGVEHALPSWLASILPDSVNSFMSYQLGILQFHTSLTTSSGQLHPWESKPWHWLIGSRPMLFYTGDSTVVDGVEKYANIWLIGNPAVWFLTVPVVVYGVYKIIKKKWQWAFIVGAILINWVPWAIGYDRQMYFFYAVAMIPFTCIAVGMMFSDLYSWGRGKRDDGSARLFHMSLVVIAVYIASVLAMYFFYQPWVMGTAITEQQHDSRMLFDFWEALEKANDEE